jgi:hypothetical protein
MSDKSWYFFGVPMTQVDFAVAVRMRQEGRCFFCKRTGLTARYGSDKKHIKACAITKAHGALASAHTCGVTE